MIFDHDNKTIWIRQSWLGTALRCSERGRFQVMAPDLDQGSDSTHCGTAVHYGIEQYLRGAIALDEMVETALHYEENNRPEQMSWKKMDNWAHLQRNIMHDLDAFAQHIAPHVPLGGRAEQSFALVLYTRADGWKVGIKGTIDYVAPNNQLWDWKTASQPYKPFEKQRYEIQPSIYGAAAVGGALGPGWAYPVIFNYGVMQHMAKRARPQIVTVQRTAGHTAWAVERINDLINMAQAVGWHQSWPKDDDHFLCSEKWCPWWHLCKGKNLGYADDQYPVQIDLGVK